MSWKPRRQEDKLCGENNEKDRRQEKVLGLSLSLSLLGENGFIQQKQQVFIIASNLALLEFLKLFAATVALYVPCSWSSSFACAWPSARGS